MKIELTGLCLLASLLIGHSLAACQPDSRPNNPRQAGPPAQAPQESGELRAGQVAPDFTLKSLDGKSETRLSSFRDRKPVVLFFGSYT